MNEEQRAQHRERNREYMRRKRLCIKLGIPFERKRQPRTPQVEPPPPKEHCQRCGMSLEYLLEYGGEWGNDEYCGDCLNEMGVV